ncbi:MAG TPA: hypothetical protein P5114_00865 [Hyphomicrobiaceae bacterium]|nr:hypothetical protein [Hyphomicrobiaceae bacterium]
MIQTPRAAGGSRQSNQYLRCFLEWAFWAVLVGVFYQQTTYFDKDIANYAFGATGWPRVVAITAFLVATFQLVMQIHALRMGLAIEGGQGRAESISAAQWAHRVAIFMWPFVFLFVTPTVGAYVSIPIFIVGFLLLLGVRKPIPLALVLVIVYGLLLAVFTRFFYVALPLGEETFFYDVNVAIVEFVRLGR